MYDYRFGVIPTVVPRGHFGIHDGDSLYAVWDRGGDDYSIRAFRLDGIDAPELSNRPAGPDSAAYLAALVGDASFVRTDLAADLFGLSLVWVYGRTTRDEREKFGRYLLTIYTTGWVSLNLMMIDSGHAVPYDGGAR